MFTIVIGGFLGSGKTTFINFLLKHSADFFPGLKTALLVNEFGDIPVDTAVIDAGNYIMREITGGCICCSLKGMLADAVRDLKETEGADLLIIEATGLALPSEIAVSAGAAGGMAVYTMLCIDPVQYEKLAGKLAIYDRQIADTDMVLLTKQDVREYEESKGVSNEIIAGNAGMICFFDKISAARRIFSNITDVGCSSHRFENHVFRRHELQHEEDISQITQKLSGIADLNKLENNLRRISEKAGQVIFRIKGIVLAEDGWKAVQYDDGKLHIISVNAPESAESFLVFIGLRGAVNSLDLKQLT